MTHPVREPADRSLAALLRVLLLCLLIGLIAVTIGYAPTRNAAGQAGVVAMLVGVGIALLGALAGLTPAILAMSHDGPARLLGALQGMALRMLVTLALGGAAAASGVFVVKPLLIWIGLAYLLFLTVDTIVLARLSNRRRRGDS